MTTVDAHGNKHNHKGQFAGRVHAEPPDGMESLALPAPDALSGNAEVDRARTREAYQEWTRRELDAENAAREARTTLNRALEQDWSNLASVEAANAAAVNRAHTVRARADLARGDFFLARSHDVVALARRVMDDPGVGDRWEVHARSVADQLDCAVRAAVRHGRRDAETELTEVRAELGRAIDAMCERP